MNKVKELGILWLPRGKMSRVVNLCSWLWHRIWRQISAHPYGLYTTNDETFDRSQNFTKRIELQQNLVEDITISDPSKSDM